MIVAPPDRVYHIIRTREYLDSLITRWLFRVRGLPEGCSSIDGLTERGGFSLLVEDPPREIVLGIVGQFWTPTGNVRTVGADQFAEYNEPGTAKAAWNFRLKRKGDRTLVSTATRVVCADDVALAAFRRYWSVIAPFSGLIRREMLRGIRNDAEKPFQGNPLNPLR